MIGNGADSTTVTNEGATFGSSDTTLTVLSGAPFVGGEVIFVDDTWGRHEWEDGWNGSDIAFPLSLRKRYGTPDAQTGSFIHETFHAIFAAIHVSQPDIDELPAGDPRRAIWAADPVDNIMGGSHLDWPTTKAKIHAITLNEMDDVDYWI